MGISVMKDCSSMPKPVRSPSASKAPPAARVAGARSSSTADGGWIQSKPLMSLIPAAFAVSTTVSRQERWICGKVWAGKISGSSNWTSV